MYEELARERFDFINMPSLKELQQKTVLMLTNSDFSFDYSEPTLPNMIHVGGLQIGDPKPLPKVSPPQFSFLNPLNCAEYSHFSCRT